MSAFWMTHIDIAIGMRAKPRLMISFVSGIVKLSSKLRTSARTLMTVAMHVPIAAPLIAPSTPSPLWMNHAMRMRLNSGREASTMMNVIGRRSNQMMMSQSLKTAADAAEDPGPEHQLGLVGAAQDALRDRGAEDDAEARADETQQRRPDDAVAEALLRALRDGVVLVVPLLAAAEVALRAAVVVVGLPEGRGAAFPAWRRCGRPG